MTKLIFVTLAATGVFLGSALNSTPGEAKTQHCKTLSNAGQFTFGKKSGKCHSKPQASTNSGVPGGGQGSSSGGGGGGGGKGGASDIRLKHDIVRVGSTVFGLPLYDFEYNFQPGTYEGVMAQDVLKVMPEAVSVGADGYYRVNYDMLGISMKRLR